MALADNQQEFNCSQISDRLKVGPFSNMHSSHTYLEFVLDFVVSWQNIGRHGCGEAHPFSSIVVYT